MSAGLAPSYLVALDETVCFATYYGGDLAVPPGHYQVEQAEPQLLLTETDDAAGH